MTNATDDGASPLADLVRAAQLPDLAERKRIRQAAGVSLDRMAAELGVSQPTVWRWENGDGPSLENAVRYAALLSQLRQAAAS